MSKPKERRDQFHHPVEVGDTVVFVNGAYKGSNYLCLGEVIRLMNKQIEIKDQKGNRYKKGPDKFIIINEQMTFNQQEYVEFYI